MNSQQVGQQLRDDGLVAIIRGNFSLGEQQAIAEALLAGGVRVLELTLNTKDALEGIRWLNETYAGELLVGAGTVRTAEYARRALDAGARFLISPGLDLETIAVAKGHDTLILPGVFTATEAQTAYRVGCSMVKLFPADALGPGYLKALRAPLHDIGFIPTGGINPDTIEAFHKAGAAAFGVGSYLVKNVPFTPTEGEALQARAAVLRSALERVRSA